MGRQKEGPDKRTWTCTGVIVPMAYRSGAKKRVTFETVDFEAMGIPMGGLLEDAIRGLPDPVGYGTFWPLVRILGDAPLEPKLIQYLGTPTTKLGSAELLDCFDLLESKISKMCKGKSASKYSYSLNAISVLRHTSHRLSDDRIPSEVRFQSQFQQGGRKSVSDVWQRISFPTSPDASLQTPFVYQDFDSLEQRNQNALTFVEKTKLTIERACIDALDRYDNLISTLQDIESRPLPTKLHKSIKQQLEDGRTPASKKGRHYKTISEETRIWLAIESVSRLQHYRFIPRSPVYNLSDIAALVPLTVNSNRQMGLFTTLLSQYYLPRLVVVACTFIIGLETGWNNDSILTLTRRDIIKTKSGYLLIGMKHRGNYSIYAELAKTPRQMLNDLEDDDEENPDRLASSQPAIRAIELLLTNNSSIKDNFGLENAPLFSFLAAGGGKFGDFIESPRRKDYEEFCEHFNLPSLTPDDIRKIKTHFEYLCPDGSVFSVNAVLNHSELQTTASYLYSTILTALYDQNILRYMKKLGASILFACGRGDILQTKETLRDHAMPELLFPASPLQPESEKSMVDRWLAANGELEFVVDTPEIHHCAYQYVYYRTHFYELAQASPERFAKCHLPRIVVCVAMRNVILASEHAGILRRYEETLNAPSPFTSNPLQW